MRIHRYRGFGCNICRKLCEGYYTLEDKKELLTAALNENVWNSKEKEGFREELDVLEKKTFRNFFEKYISLGRHA